MPDKIDFPTLLDFALGRLTREESNRVLDEVEKNPQLSYDLNLVIKLLELVRERGDSLFPAEKAKRPKKRR
jgi:hypothetical protein